MKKKVLTKRSSAGLGLFAGEPIKRGETIIEYVGPTISTDEADKKGGKYLFSLNEKWTIDGSDRSNTARYINHSCKPNAYAELSANEKRVFIIAKRAIKLGEEITYDYGKEYVEMMITPYGCKCASCLST
jgi:SET domain-containing protein